METEIAELKGEIRGRAAALPYQRTLRNRFLLGLLLLAIMAVVGWSLKPVPEVRVWVNTRSGLYHCPGSSYYGRTADGRYETEKRAKEEGFKPSAGQVCR